KLRMRLEQIEHAMRHRYAEWIAAVRSAGKRLAVGCKNRHDVFATTECGDGYSATHDLAERGEIGRYAEPALCTARAEAQPRDDLVEDQERAPAPGALPQTFEKAGDRRNEPHVERDRLDHDRGDLVFDAFGELIGGIEIVVTRDECVATHARRNS